MGADLSLKIIDSGKQRQASHFLPVAIYNLQAVHIHINISFSFMSWLKVNVSSWLLLKQEPRKKNLKYA